MPIIKRDARFCVSYIEGQAGMLLRAGNFLGKKGKFHSVRYSCEAKGIPRSES